MLLFEEETKHFEIKLSLNVLSTQDGATFEPFGHPDAFLHSLKILIGEFSKNNYGEQFDSFAISWKPTCWYIGGNKTCSKKNKNFLIEFLSKDSSWQSIMHGQKGQGGAFGRGKG